MTIQVCWVPLQPPAGLPVSHLHTKQIPQETSEGKGITLQQPGQSHENNGTEKIINCQPQVLMVRPGKDFLAKSDR